MRVTVTPEDWGARAEVEKLEEPEDLALRGVEDREREASAEGREEEAVGVGWTRTLPQWRSRCCRVDQVRCQRLARATHSATRSNEHTSNSSLSSASAQIVATCQSTLAASVQLLIL